MRYSSKVNLYEIFHAISGKMFFGAQRSTLIILLMCCVLDWFVVMVHCLLQCRLFLGYLDSQDVWSTEMAISYVLIHIFVEES